MKTSDGRGESFVVARKTPKARGPSKGALYDPASWEQNKTALR